MRSSSSTQYVGPDVELGSEDVEEVAGASECRIQLTTGAKEAVQSSRNALDTLRTSGTSIYGLTTGFGPLHEHDAEESNGHAHGLISHLATGSGDALPGRVVRAMMMARIQSLAQGHSAIRPSSLERVIDLLEANVTPAVPEIGSLGASGDLTPLAHVARVCIGEGTVLGADGTVRPADTALERVDLEPISLDARDALALVNGTSFMTASAALAVARTERLVERAEMLAGWMYRLLGCSLEPLDPTLQQVRGHDGQIESARAIRQEASRGDGASATDGPLQEVYSLRCAPQILGAVRDQLTYVRGIVECELNGVTDNPVIDPQGPAALHGGNFQGQQVAFAADALNEAVTQMGVLAERQVDLLLSSSGKGNAPPLLAWEPGPTSGLAGAQLTATALVAELRQDAQMTATSSIPTNDDNQDVVSMGALAARTAYEQTDHLAPILAILGMSLAQLTHLRSAGRSEGPAPPMPDWMPPFEPVIRDRALRTEIDEIAEKWLTPDT